MPGRTYTKKKKGYAKRGAKRGSIYGAAAGQLWKDVKLLKEMVNVEYKTLDTTGSGLTAPFSSSNANWLSTVTTGTAYNQRTGNSVKAVRLYLDVKMQLGATETQSRFRIIVFRNQRGDQGVLPQTSDLTQDPTNVASPMRIDNFGDYQILSDKIFVMDTVGSGKLKNFRFRCKLNHHVRWDQTGDAIADTEAGHIFFVVTGDSYTTNAPIYDYYARLRFIDN